MSLLHRFRRLAPAEQLIALSVVLDPAGFAAGFLLGPAAGLDPFVGAAVGLTITSSIAMVWFGLGRT